MKRCWLVAAWLGLFVLAQFPVAGRAGAEERKDQAAPPPATIADITAILDEEKPDSKAVAQLRANADAEPPAGADRARLANFHYERCQARNLLGELAGALADCKRAVELGEGVFEPQEFGILLQGLALQYRYSGDSKKALDVYLRMRSLSDSKGAKGLRFNANWHIVKSYIDLGDLDQAEETGRRSVAAFQEARGWRNYDNAFLRPNWEGEVERTKAALFAARGRFHEAELAYHRAEILKTETLQNYSSYPHKRPPPKTQIEQAIDGLIADEGAMKSRQGRYAEGEADVRRALLSRLRATGKYQVVTADYIGFLASQLVEQGRLVEAEKLTRTRLDILRTLGLANDTENIASALNQLATILNLQGRWREAGALYAELDQATKNWTPAHREALTLGISEVATLYNTNNLQAGLAAAERLLTRQRERFGEKHIETALARGMLAIGLSRAGRDPEAAAMFKEAIPVLISGSREIDVDDAIEAAARAQRLGIVIEAYIDLLSRSTIAEATAESFWLADLLRSRSVEKALAASSARAAAGNPALSELARKAQDLEKEIAGELNVLNGALALPTEQRDDKAVRELEAKVGKLRASRDATNAELAHRFPKYSSLVDPAPPSVADAQALLHDDEALVAFLTIGSKSPTERTFVWIVTKAGARWTPVDLGSSSLEDEVAALRCGLDRSQWRDPTSWPEDTEARKSAKIVQLARRQRCLELEGEAARSSSVQGAQQESLQRFDLPRAYSLYKALFGRIEDLTKDKHLIVVPSGPLTQMPFQVLITAPPDPSLSGLEALRHAQWLIRRQDITVLPSVSSLNALRLQGNESRATRALIGFGNPLLDGMGPDDSDRAARARANSACPVAVASLSAEPLGISPLLLRGGRADVAQIRSAPPLPETADELCAVAADLHVPAGDIYLGARATVQQVSDLSRSGELQQFHIIHFATHGALSGQINGSDEPGLILTPPETATDADDGYLSASKIASLKLDADWVILSACNTAAGGSKDAEALSGLARAFFYAGTRALLVSHWSVYSDTTVKLITGAISRMAADHTVGRAAALRDAMLALIDKGDADEANPAFWAPFTLVGEGAAVVR